MRPYSCRIAAVAGLAEHIEEPGVREALCNAHANEPNPRVSALIGLVLSGWDFDPPVPCDEPTRPDCAIALRGKP